jgi:hypothetical protein
MSGSMVGKLTSVENGPERNVKLTISRTEVCSEISSPAGSYNPQIIDHYEVSGLQDHDKGLVTLTLVLADQQRVQFYSTHSKFDMALQLDQLDATLGVRERKGIRTGS